MSEVNSTEREESGLPDVSSSVTTPASEASNDTDNPTAGVDADSSTRGKSSLWGLLAIVVCVTSLCAAAGWVLYKQYMVEQELAEQTLPLNGGHKDQSVIDHSTEKSSDGVDLVVADSAAVPVAFEEDYLIGGGVKNAERTVPESTLGDLPQKVTELPKPEEAEVQHLNQSDMKQLLDAIEANNRLMTGVMNNQDTLLSEIRAAKNVTETSSGIQSLMFDTVKGILAGQEALVLSLTRTSNSTKKSFSPVKSKPLVTKPSTRVVEPDIEKPSFILPTHSVWDREVTLVVETEDGFSKPATIGTSINGWVLLDINVKKKRSTWQKSGVKHELPFG